MTPLEAKLAEVATALAAFVSAKKSSTALLTDFVNKFNARTPDQSAALSAYVSKFNELTALSDQLRTVIAQAQDLVVTMTVQLQNLTDTQVEEMQTNPPQYFAAGYLALSNSLLFYGRENGLAIADLVCSDLKTDINNAYDDLEAGVTPETPRIAIVFESGHALDLVNKALADVSDPVTGIA